MFSVLVAVLVLVLVLVLIRVGLVCMCWVSLPCRRSMVLILSSVSFPCGLVGLREA